MKEYDGSPFRVTRLDRVQFNSAAPDDHVVLQHVAPLALISKIGV